MVIYRKAPQERILRESMVTSEELRGGLNFNIKSNNYLIRSYIATESKSRGGYLAIEADKDGYLLEGSAATVAVLLKSGEFVIPPFDRILPGTTAIKILAYLQTQIDEGQLNDYVNKISRREILVSEAKAECREVMFLGGEECVPITSWDS
jgi:branched-subunit amino acid aminotransferase/4-amino-4-deoxychorismate lyase